MIYISPSLLSASLSELSSELDRMYNAKADFAGETDLEPDRAVACIQPSRTNAG